MYSYNDFERLFVRYKLEGIPARVSIEKFCNSCSGFGCSLTGIRNEGKAFTPGTNAGSGYPAFFAISFLF